MWFIWYYLQLYSVFDVPSRIDLKTLKSRTETENTNFKNKYFRLFYLNLIKNVLS